MTQTTRRALLGAAALVPVALAATASHAAGPVADPRWAALVADYRAKHSAWLDVCGYEDDLLPQLRKACAALPPEPQKPESSLANIDHMTIAEIRASGQDRVSKAAWADYERDHAAWKEQRKALRESILGPAKKRYDAIRAAYASALNALTSYRPSTLRQLAEKIEIITAEYEGCEVPMEYMGEILADVRHMAGEARA